MLPDKELGEKQLFNFGGCCVKLNPLKPGLLAFIARRLRRGKHLLIGGYPKAISAYSRCNQPFRNSFGCGRVWRKEINNLFRSHMFTVIGRPWRRTYMGISSKFTSNYPLHCLQVHKFVMTSLEIALLQANSHGQDLSVGHLWTVQESVTQLNWTESEFQGMISPSPTSTQPTPSHVPWISSTTAATSDPDDAREGCTRQVLRALSGLRCILGRAGRP